MSAPVIDSTTSVLGYKQWESWEYQPFATNGPGRWRANTALPTGLSLDEVSGKLSGPVQVPGVFLTGLTAINGYEVTRVACRADNTSNLNELYFTIYGAGGSIAFWFNVASGGSAPSTGAGTTVAVAVDEDATATAVATALEAAMLAQDAWYARRDGAVLYIYDKALGTRTDASDTGGTGFLINVLSQGAASATESEEVMFTIGIEPGALIEDLLPLIQIDTVTGAVTLDGAAAADGSPLLTVKEGDDLLLRVGFVRAGTPVVVTAADDAIRLVLKQYEPEGELTASLESKPEAGTQNYLLHAKFDGDAIAAALSDYEADDGTFFDALAEIEATVTNPFFGTCGPETIVRTSATFRVRIERDIANNA